MGVPWKKKKEPHIGKWLKERLTPLVEDGGCWRGWEHEELMSTAQQRLPLPLRAQRSTGKELRSRGPHRVQVQGDCQCIITAPPSQPHPHCAYTTIFKSSHTPASPFTTQPWIWNCSNLSSVVHWGDKEGSRFVWTALMGVARYFEIVRAPSVFWVLKLWVVLMVKNMKW